MLMTHATHEATCKYTAQAHGRTRLNILWEGEGRRNRWPLTQIAHKTLYL